MKKKKQQYLHTLYFDKLIPEWCWLYRIYGIIVCRLNKHNFWCWDDMIFNCYTRCACLLGDNRFLQMGFLEYFEITAVKQLFNYIASWIFLTKCYYIHRNCSAIKLSHSLFFEVNLHKPLTAPEYLELFNEILNATLPELVIRYARIDDYDLLK